MCDNILYKILGVKSYSSLLEIKEAYKTEAIKRSSNECIINGCLKELDYVFDVLTDPIKYKIEFNNEYNQIEVFYATRREIYDREGLAGLEFFSQNSTSFVEQITDNGFMERHFVGGFPHVKLMEEISNCSLKSNTYPLQNSNEVLDLSQHRSENQNIELRQRDKLPEKDILLSKRFKSTDDKPHKCQNIAYSPQKFRCTFPNCYYMPTRRRDLNNHIKCVHLKQYDYKCNWPDCGRTYASNQSLRYHMNIHSGVKPYECKREFCSKSFHSINSLRYHLKTHEKPNQEY